MLNVPKKANDALNLSLLEGCDVRIDTLGDVVLLDPFIVWDPKQLIRKGRDRHIFLFELYLLFSKEVKDSAGKVGFTDTYIISSALLKILNRVRMFMTHIPPLCQRQQLSRERERER